MSSLYCVFPDAEITAHLVLDHWLRRCAPVTHQDQGWRALRCVAPGCVGSPRKPSDSHRVQSTRPIKPAAQVCGFAQARSNPLWLTVRAQRTPWHWAGSARGVVRQYPAMQNAGGASGAAVGLRMPELQRFAQHGQRPAQRFQIDGYRYHAGRCGSAGKRRQLDRRQVLSPAALLSCRRPTTYCSKA